ncbi:MAG: cation:proton antiporter [Candidatus Omnitrophota bacterium]
MNVLLLIGLTIFLGTLGGKIFEKLKIPQVVAYVVLGLILGKSFFGIWGDEVIEQFTPAVNLALGFIGFLIGSELKLDLFKRKGHAIYSILFSESLMTFFVVMGAVTLVTHKFYYGLLFGALAAATAPAATVDVLWEYKTRGPLTTTLLAIVALDDAVALILYAFASTFSKSLIAREHFSLFHTIQAPLVEICLTAVLGAAGGYILFKLIRFIKDKERILPFTLGIITMAVGAAVLLKIDLILVSMMLGLTLANLAPEESKEIFSSVRKFSPPVYVLFFVLVGARLDIFLFTKAAIAVLAVVYVVSRSLGKISGAFFGGLIGKAQPTVTKYLGLCLFSQAGVAIGLAISLYHNLGHLGPEASQVGLTVINVIVATTFLVQIIGPPSVRYAVFKAGEAYRNITEDDIIDSYRVGDLMDKETPVIRQNMPLYSIVSVMKESEAYHFCVVGEPGDLRGILSLGDLRSSFLEQEAELNHLVLAGDIAVATTQYISASRPLKEAIEIFRRKDIDFLPVIEDEASMKLVGAMHYHQVMTEIHRQLFERRGSI